MQLISVQYYHDGYWKGPSGNMIKQFKKRLKLKCGACGKVVTRYCFGSVKSKTCGCVQYQKHGMTGGGKRHPLYGKWTGMRSRCYNKNNRAYSSYGGAGIKVCATWMVFSAFYQWAIQAGWKPGHKLFLDRKKNSGNYTPANCRWVSVLESNRNRTNCITHKQAAKVHSLLASGKSAHDIAGLTGVLLHTVQNIASGACWRGVK